MNGITYEASDGWWIRHGATVGFWVVFAIIFAVIAWGMMQ